MTDKLFNGTEQAKGISQGPPNDAHAERRRHVRAMIKVRYGIRGDREFPIIPVTLIKDDVEIDTDALIDSGANISVFR